MSKVLIYSKEDLDLVLEIEKQKLEEENEQLKEEIKQYQKKLEKADSITQSCIFEGSRSAGKSYRQCLNWLED